MTGGGNAVVGGGLALSLSENWKGEGEATVEAQLEAEEVDMLVLRRSRMVGGQTEGGQSSSEVRTRSRTDKALSVASRVIWCARGGRLARSRLSVKLMKTIPADAV